jgi:uncharacterized protein
MAFDPYIIVASFVGLSTAGAFVATARNEKPDVVLPAPPPVSSTAKTTLSPSSADLGVPVVLSHPIHGLSSQAMAAITTRARKEVELGVKYDASYKPFLAYPGGDVPADRGACTDLVIRAFRAAEIDLQVLVHEDMKANLDIYADVGAEGVDSSIDHRRTGPLFLFFKRNATTLPNIKPLAATKTATATRSTRDAFRAGDIVFFNYKTKCKKNEKYTCIPDHVALVSDRIGPRGLPLVLQNGGPASIESDSLDGGTMVGHFRLND